MLTTPINLHKDKSDSKSIIKGCHDRMRCNALKTKYDKSADNEAKVKVSKVCKLTKIYKIPTK